MIPLLLAALALAPAEPSLEALVDRVESHYAGVSGFEAAFTQRYERRLLSRVIEEKGKLAVKKPGRMRWEYESPEEKLFVTDGTKSYFYLPEENQVLVSHDPTGAMGMEEGSPFELLAGRSRLGDSFAFFPSDQTPTEGGVMLKLLPLREHEEFEEVELEVSPDTGRVLRVVLLDLQRNRTEFVFSDVRENVDLPESLFRFTVPSGVEVVVQSGGGAP